jgi:hypothetical protein
MMTNGDIAARIEALKDKVVERVVEETGITMADIVAGLAKIAFNDAVTEGYGLDIKRKALVDIGKHLGGFVTRKEIGGPGQFDRMSTDELRKAVYERSEAVVAARRQDEQLRLRNEAEPLEGSLIKFFAAAWAELDASPFTCPVWRRKARA